jgi:hypothetical protein
MGLVLVSAGHLARGVSLSPGGQLNVRWASVDEPARSARVRQAPAGSLRDHDPDRPGGTPAVLRTHLPPH